MLKDTHVTAAIVARITTHCDRVRSEASIVSVLLIESGLLR